jgi:hypothetical protein
MAQHAFFTTRMAWAQQQNRRSSICASRPANPTNSELIFCGVRRRESA